MDMETTTATALANIDRLGDDHQGLLALIVEQAQDNGGDFAYVDEVAQAWGTSDKIILPMLRSMHDAGFLTLWGPERINGVGTTVQQISAPGIEHFADPRWVQWASVDFADVEAAPGTPEAARDELARRAHNKRAKTDKTLARIEAASDWAFTASGPELKALAGEA